MPNTRNSRPTKNYGGSYTPPPQGEEPKKFILKEKISDMMKYSLPLLDSFPRRNRKLADTLRESLLRMYRLAIELERSAFLPTAEERNENKRKALRGLDVELAVVKEFVVLASDRDYCGAAYAPPLSIHQREVWSKKNDEIGKIIGGYTKAVNAKRG